MKAVGLFFFLFLFSSNVSAGMRVSFSDVFPMCAADRTGDYNVLRCGAELLMPNLHVSAIINMFIKLIEGIFKLAVDLVAGVLNPINWIDFLRRCFFPDFSKIGKGEGEGIVDAPAQLLSGIVWTIFGLATPIIVLLMLFLYELMKTYLLFAVPACLWKNAIEEAGDNTPSEAAKIALVAVSGLAIFFGTVFLAGMDIGLWTLLFNTG